MNAKKLLPPSGPDVPALLPWSRGHRLYPFEQELGEYMPAEIVTAAVLATGYKSPISLEVLNASLHERGLDVPSTHAKRGITGLKKLSAAVIQLPAFWLNDRHSRTGSVRFNTS